MISEKKSGAPYLNVWFGNFYRPAYDDQAFVAFFPFIAQAAGDRRNFVKKAVNWALRQIGKRNMALNHEAIRLAETLRQQPHASAKWIAADALRELTNPKILARIHQKNSSRNHPDCA